VNYARRSRSSCLAVLPALALALLAGACAPSPPPSHVEPPRAQSAPSASAPANAESPGLPATSDADARFADLSARFLREYLRRAPVIATINGDHTYDARWPDVSVEGDADHARFIATLGRELASIPRDRLSMSSRVDADIVANELARWRLAIEEVKDAERNPLFYTALIGDGLDPLLTREFATHAERMHSLRGRLAGIPALVAVAKKRLVHPARVSTETAIAQNKGLIALCDSGLAADIAKEPDQRAELEVAAKSASAALRELQTFFETDLLARSDGSFRVGRAKLEKIMRYGLDDDIALDDLAKGARELLTRTQDEMANTAAELWPSLMKAPLPAMTTKEDKKRVVRKVLDKLAEEHSSNTTILADAKRILDGATRFVREHDLVRVPDEPCSIIEMPEYRRGVAIAYCDSSGPLEKKQETFFSISPTPRDWPAKRALSFYREYNQSMLADLTVHEAMPGHYLQAMHAAHGASILRGVFASGAFVEGWAVYGEWLMSKYGFGGAKVRLERQKMVLRLAANAILDHDIHAGTMEEKDALLLMTDEAFQEEGEAVAKWRRARLSSGQLTTYYYGFTEMMKLRATAEQKPAFKERAYHDKLLSFGAPAMRYMRELMKD
jgi:uncharacterized protein (DUF885 family)